MFTPTQIKLPPVATLAIATGLVLAGCGQAPTIATGTQTVAKAATTTVRASTRYDIKAIEASIKKQLEKNIPDLTVTISGMKVWQMPTILPHPAPAPTLFGFSAIESVTGFAGRTDYYEIEGTYDVTKSLATVTNRVPMRYR
ncbi:MAG: hypothetical protein FJZ01_25310 [Candidatus Sericytochromatia bacterium]|nr:hypothetical protein [Candidatus Tanganyikabacteria bacterium]